MTSREEVDKNYEYFDQLLKAGELDDHLGEWVLLSNKKIIDYFSKAEDAYDEAEKRYKQDASFLCSIQEIRKEHIEMFGYACEFV